MRSRYTAYALGDTRYLMNTTDPEGPHHRSDRGGWKEELAQWCRSTAFEGLEVVDQSEAGDAGRVHFRATLRSADGKVHVMEERSRFRRRNGRWLYTDAEG